MRLLLLVLFATFIAALIGLGALALEATGLDSRKARFQALSAFSGTGFTTSEAEAVIRHPQRRRVISILMVVGNLGILSLLGALVVLLMRGAGSRAGLGWALVLVAAALVYGLALGRWVNPTLKRCLARLFHLRPVEIEKLTTLPDGRAVLALTVTEGSGLVGHTARNLEAAGVQVLAGVEAGELKPGDMVICVGRMKTLRPFLA
jgi:lysylphosphatidylglycerol synthetase-like protein (DUF2156 family)